MASTPRQRVTANASWAGSFFAALGDADHRLLGRNFDWRYSPARLLFTDPPATGVHPVLLRERGRRAGCDTTVSTGVAMP